MSHTLGYRPDIDGLRAVAVLLVVIFHSKLGCPGGFVGVDVFFVLSGYLITGIILKEQSAGDFRYLDFWGRRVMRLVPAAACMTLATIAAGYAWLLPADYIALAQSAIYQQGMLANIFFWRSAGYFSGPADMMPLLHTWSLAVEEQFYLLYPWLLTFLCRLPPGWRLLVLGSLAATSLAVSELYISRSPAAVFFLLPTRAWELLLGGALWFLPPCQLFLRPIAANAIAAVGLGSILSAAFWLDSSTAFPGLRAVAPCAGTALLIQSASTTPTALSILLSNRFLVTIGRASYSIYLWHWPAIVFLRHCVGETPSHAAMTTVVAAAMSVAFCSWYLIELPSRSLFRKAQRAGWLSVALGAFGIVLSLCLVIIAFAGFPGRVPQLALTYHAAQHARSNDISVTLPEVRQGRLPRFGDSTSRTSCLIWGDSHAMTLVAGLANACHEEKISGFQITHFGTAPLIDFYLPQGLGLRENAVEYADAVIDFIRRERIEIVILAAYWVRYESNPLLADRLSATIRALSQDGIAVAVVLDYATQNENVPLMLARKVFRGDSTANCGVTMSRYLEKNAGVNDAIRKAAGTEAVVLDPAPYLTDSQGIWRCELNGTVLYYDDDHITTDASSQLKPMFQQLFRRLSQRRDLPKATPNNATLLRSN